MSDRKTITIERLRAYGETWGNFYGDEGTIQNIEGASIDYGAFSSYHENIIYAVYVEDLEEVTIEKAMYRLYGFRLAVREKYKNDKLTLEGGVDGWFYPVLFGDFEPDDSGLWQLKHTHLEYWQITDDITETVMNIMDARETA